MASGSKQTEYVFENGRVRVALESADDVFALRDDAAESLTSSVLRKEDSADLRKRVVACLVVLLVLVCASLHLGVTYQEVYSPLDVVSCLGEWVRLNVGSLIFPQINFEATSVLDRLPMYYQVQARLARTFIYVLCGGMLAVSGMLYQNTFRNPIAAPTMLGVSGGVEIGCVLLVVLTGTAALSENLEALRVLFCFAGGLIVLALVVLAAKFMSGRGPINLVNLLIMGTIVSALLRQITNYVLNSVFAEDQWNAYYSLVNSTDVTLSGTSCALFLVAFVVSLAPVVALRFRMNVVSLSDQEMRIFGVNPNALRAVALASGSLMVLTAQVFVGAVSVLTLVVPFLARAVFGTEFRKQLVGCLLLGAIVLLVCGTISSLIVVSGVTFPLATITSVITLPLFVWVMAAAQTQMKD